MNLNKNSSIISYNTVMDTVNCSVVKEMLADRGYIPSSINEEDGQIHACNDVGENIIVFFVKGKLNIEVIREHVELLKENDIRNGIIICTDDITPRGKNIIDTVNNIGEMRIEVFNAKDFICNKTKHRLVPKHIKMDKDSAKSILKKYGKIPELLFLDPISRYYGFSIGDVVKIIRNDGGICYRIVV